jgi:hypothetical protein
MAEPHPGQDESGPPPLWGVAAEFTTAAEMLDALHTLAAQRLGRLEAYSPVPVPGAEEALGMREHSTVPFAVGAAVLGGIAMMAMCLYATIVSYRFNIGGRPLVSWPAFVVPSVSFAMLVGAIVAVGLMLMLNRMPRLNHPAFNIPNFTRASRDRFFVAVEARDATFDAASVEAVFAGLAAPPSRISRVPR